MIEPFGLNPVIHAQGRLRVVTALSTLGREDSISFTRLQSLLGMTSGNLAGHLRRLEDARFVTVLKTFVGRQPATYVGMTETGRIAFDLYKQSLRSLLD